MLEDLLALVNSGCCLKIIENRVIGATASIAGPLIIPEGVLEIGDYAFKNNSTITSVTFPSSLRSIGKEAFYKCTALEEIHFPEQSHLVDIGTSCFSSCACLKPVSIPASVLSVGDKAFSSCYNSAEFAKQQQDSRSNLSTHIFGKAVSDIENNGCAVQELHIYENTQIGASCFAGTEIMDLYIDSLVVMPMAFANSLIHRVHWNSAATIIPDGAFEGSAIEEFIISEYAAKNLHTIGSGAFSYCTNLHSFSLSPEITVICDSAFKTSGLIAFTANKNLMLIGNHALEATPCEYIDLREATKLEKIGSYAFAGTKIKQLYVNSSQRIFSDNVVNGCTQLELLNLGASIEHLICTSNTPYGQDITDSTLFIEGKTTKVSTGWQMQLLMLPKECPEPGKPIKMSTRVGIYTGKAFGRSKHFKGAIIRY